jgi:DNA-binding transcriptional MerR regulator
VVLDAVGFSPAQIKAMLDAQPWSQEIEDLYRGVDGRKVVDYVALYNLPDYYRPPRWTAEEFEEKKKEIARRNKELIERIEKEREGRVDVDVKYACSRKQADYDLSPKGD